MTDVISRIRSQGGLVGKAPFGFKAERDERGMRRAKPDEGEQKIISAMRGFMRDFGTAKATAHALNVAGSLRRGKLWTVHSVEKCLGALESNTFSGDLLKELSD